MAQKTLIILQSPTGHVRYTRKNPKGVERKIELKKFDPLSRKHEVYKEVKKLRSIKKK